MGVCGCGDRCTCSLVPGDNVTITGSGDVFDPYIISSTETVFAASNTDNAVAITPAGLYGHTPVINIAKSSDGGNILEKRADGLYVGSTALAVATRYIGELIDVTGPSTPGLTLEALGQEVAAASYPALATEYGFTGVPGAAVWDDGTENPLNFRMPDLRERSTIGRGTTKSLGQTDSIAEGSRSNTHTHSTPSVAVSGTAAGTSATHAFTIETGVGASDTQAQWNVVNDTINNTTPNDGDCACSIRSIAGTGPDPGISITAVSTVSSINSTHDHGVNVPVTGSSSAGTTGAATIPYATVRKVVFAGV